MPIVTKHVSTGPLLFRLHEAAGMLSAEEVWDKVMAVYAGYPLAMPVLCDVRGASLTGLRGKDLEAIARFIAYYPRRALGSGHSKIAIVASAAPDSGICCSFQAYMESSRSPREVRIFDGRPDALSWLGDN